MKRVVPFLLLFALALGLYAYREHREVQRQNEVLHEKDRETNELKERTEALAQQQKQHVDQNETRLAQLENGALSKETADKLSAEQQRAQTMTPSAGLGATLQQEIERLATLKQRRDTLASSLGGEAATTLEKRIRQEGEDLKSYEDRVKSYRASYQTQVGTQKQQLAQLRSNYEVEYARLKLLMNNAEGAMRLTREEQVTWRRRKIDSARPQKLQDLAAQLASQSEQLTVLKNQMTSTRSAEQLDIQYLQSQIHASDTAAQQAGAGGSSDANLAKSQIADLKSQKVKVDQDIAAGWRELKTLNEEIRVQEARIKQLQRQIK
ncbi:hypothetical protein BH10BDE1_BH10BDE1_10390 [soil metagenome]